jgi:hypothetical protein
MQKFPFDLQDGVEYGCQTMTEGKFMFRWLGWEANSDDLGTKAQALALYSTLLQQGERPIRVVRVSRYALPLVVVEVLKYAE